MSYREQNRTNVSRVLLLVIHVTVVFMVCAAEDVLADLGDRTITGYVQTADLRRVGQATVELRDQEGTLVTTQSTNDAGEFTLVAPQAGAFSVSAIRQTSRSEYVVIESEAALPTPVVLTLAESSEIALDVTAPFLPIQPDSSSETYAVSRKEIEALPRGNNLSTADVLLTIPSAVNGSLGQVHIRQDHANVQLRIDGVPIPDTISAQFTDLLHPRVWERADIILGGMEAQYGNRTAAVIDITSKSGTKPGFGSLQAFGGSNESVMPSFEYGGTVGDRFRFYVMNNYLKTNRGIDPPTLGQSIFHGDGERNQTFLRGDYQLNNRNNVTWLLLNSVADYQIPTQPGLSPHEEIEELIRDHTDPQFVPKPSEAIDENQQEHNQYSHLVWRHDVNANQFFSVAGYFRHSRATFTTDPYDVLAYTQDEGEPFSAGDQDRWGIAGGMRLDYTHVMNSRHTIKAGFQIDRTSVTNKTRLFAFAREEEDEDGPHEEDEDGPHEEDEDGPHEEDEDGPHEDEGASHHHHDHGEPAGGVLNRNADRRIVGYREEFWIQDQFKPNEHWTLNLGLRLDHVHGYISATQVSPRVGVTYAPNDQHAFHAFYGRLFTPPNLEGIPFQVLNTQGTTAAAEDQTNVKTNAERSHYVELGSKHAIGDGVVLQLTGYYKVSTNMHDAHQFGATPMLNWFAHERGWQRGIEGSLKARVTDAITARANVAWGQSKGYGLQSGHFLLHEHELNDIRTSEGVFTDHSQTMTSSAVLTWRPWQRTTITGQMLYGSGLRSASDGARTNSGHADSHTTYNVSMTRVFPVSTKQKLLVGFDVVNLFDQREFLNVGEQSVGLGVSHANTPRSFFFRAQWFF